MSNATSTPRGGPSGVLRVAEAAERLRVCERTVYNAIRAGRIEAFRIGSTYRIPEEALWNALRVRRDGETSRDPMPRPRRSGLRDKVASIEQRGSA